MVEMTIPPFKTAFSVYDLALSARQSYFHTAASMGIPVFVGCIFFIYCRAVGGRYPLRFVSLLVGSLEDRGPCSQVVHCHSLGH